jgi:predicted DNA-binding transcriptional regulator AlpA
MTSSPRSILRRELAALLGCSVRTIDRHGIARGNLKTRKEAAALLDLPIRTFDRYHANGHLPREKKIIGIPMWRADELLAFKKSLSPSFTQISLPLQ